LSQVRATALLVTFVTDGAGQALGFVARWAASLATRAPSFRATGAPRAQPCRASAARFAAAGGVGRRRSCFGAG
jgi:hypothetical protein